MAIIKEFKGLYTNIDENDVTLEHLAKASNVRILPGRIKWEGKTLKKVSEEFIINIQWAGYIYLEEDKNANKVINGVLYKDYKKPEFIEYYAKIKTTNTDIMVFLDNTITPTVTHNTNTSGTELIEVWNVINDDGRLKIFTDRGSYVLQKIDRTLFGVTKSEYQINKLILPFDKTSKYLSVNLSITDEPELALDSIDCNMIIVAEYKYPAPPHIGGDYDLIDVKLVGSQTIYPPNLNSPYLQHTPDVLTFEKVRIEPLGIGYKIPKVWANYLNPKVNSWDAIKAGDFNTFMAWNEPCYVLKKNVILGTVFKYTGGRKVKDIGINKQYRHSEILATLLTDNEDEYPVAYNEISYKGTKDKYAIKVNIDFLPNLNNRITGLALYLKKYMTEEDSGFLPFEQIKFYNFNQGEQKTYNEFYISGISPNGILLSQTIGIDFNIDTYESVDRIKDYLNIGNYAYAISDGKVHHSAIGNGKVLFHTFHKNQFIPIPYPNVLSYSGNYAVVNSDDGTTLIKQGQENGVVLFNIDETYPYTIKNKLDSANYKDILLLHTKTGIWLLQNGKEPNLISNPINDIVELYYDTGLIAVDETNEILYYLPKYDSTLLFTFKFLDGTWTTIDSEVTQPIKFISWKDDGIAFINDKVYSVINDSTKLGEIISHKSFLGESNYYKALNRFEIDFIGIVEFNGKQFINTFRNNTNIAVPLKERIPFEKLGYSLLIYPGTEIYQITLDVEALMKVRF